MKVELEDFIRFVRLLNGETLRTTKQRKPFRIDVSEQGVVTFTPEFKGKPRSDLSIERYLDIYNNCGPQRTSDYEKQDKNLRNASYFHAVITEYSKPQNRILTTGSNNASKNVETQREAVIQARNGQGKFRTGLSRYWDHTCSVTKVGNKHVLRASHIKPWRDSDNKERLDKFNGLLLTPNLDALFDSGLITFKDSGKIKISGKISPNDLKVLNVDSSMSLRKEKIRKEHTTFLAYHRTEIFRE